MKLSKNGLLAVVGFIILSIVMIIISVGLAYIMSVVNPKISFAILRIILIIALISLLYMVYDMGAKKDKSNNAN